ncbi:MAG: hypothetical protein U5L01_03525 [Rheinheimera sp.]|nr:hypothetical protein [Rheinheimera sp.]
MKSTQEIHHALEGADDDPSAPKVVANGLMMVLIQIMILDIVFSLDSVITAVGLVNDIEIMAIAIIAAVAVMMFAAKPIGDFVDAHPSIKILALSFLILVGVMLMIEGFDHHVPKGYIYFAMAFSVVVEMINIRMRKKSQNRYIYIKTNLNWHLAIKNYQKSRFCGFFAFNTSDQQVLYSL